MKSSSSTFRLLTAACCWASSASLLPAAEPSVQFAEESPTLTKTGVRQPIPDANAQRSSLAKIQEVFKEEYVSAKSTAAKTALARRLFEEAQDSKEQAERWCLLNESLRLATEGGDVSLSLSAVSMIESSFNVDSSALRTQSLIALSGKSTARSAEDIAREAMRLVSGSDGASSDDVADKLRSLALSMARKSQNRELIAQVQAMQSAKKDRDKLEKEYQSLLAEWQKSPEDPDVNVKFGSFLCFRLSDWHRGLPLLARGADADLASLAQAEASMGDSPPLILAVADRWANYATEKKASAKSTVESHAYELYSRIVNRLEGLERTRIQKRMAALGNSTVLAGPPNVGPRSIPGLMLWLDATKGISSTKTGDSSESRMQRWQDQSGKGNDVIQPDESKRPLRALGSIDFDGSTFMTGQQPLNSTALTIVAVYEATKETAESTLASTRTQSSSGWILDHVGGGGVYFRVFGADKLTEVRLSPAVAVGRRICIASVSSAGEIGLELAGDKRANAPVRVNPAPSPTPLHVGAKTGYSGGGNFRGSLNHLLIYDRSLDVNEQAVLLKWLAGSQ